MGSFHWVYCVVWLEVPSQSAFSNSMEPRTVGLFFLICVLFGCFVVWGFGFGFGFYFKSVSLFRPGRPEIYYIAQTGLKLIVIPLPQPSECWADHNAWLRPFVCLSPFSLLDVQVPILPRANMSAVFPSPALVSSWSECSILSYSAKQIHSWTRAYIVLFLQ